jgi:inhibitor of KinA
VTPVRIVRAGDSALLANFGDQIDPDINDRVVATAAALQRMRLRGVRDIVPAFASVAVYFDPLVADVAELADRLHAAAAVDAVSTAAAVPIDIPVCYEPPFAPDLDEVARFARSTPDEVVQLHAARVYRVFMLGFLPGFAYLGIVDPRIAAPRRHTPRTDVPAGSVAIAGGQTGVYPRRSPGGWNIIGRTSLPMVSAGSEPHARLSAGDRVRFRPVSRREFDEAAAPAGPVR